MPKLWQSAVWVLALDQLEYQRHPKCAPPRVCLNGITKDIKPTNIETRFIERGIESFNQSAGEEEKISLL